MGQAGRPGSLGQATAPVLLPWRPPSRGACSRPPSYPGSFSLGISSPARLQNGTGSNSGPARPHLHLQGKVPSDVLRKLPGPRCTLRGTSGPTPALQPHFWTEPMSIELKINLPLCSCRRTLLGLQGRARTRSHAGRFPMPLRPAFPQEVLNGEIPSIPRGTGMPRTQRDNGPVGGREGGRG